MEHILLGAITNQMKHMIRKSQHGLTKGKLCLTDVVALYDKTTCLVDVVSGGHYLPGFLQGF